MNDNNTESLNNMDQDSSANAQDPINNLDPYNNPLDSAALIDKYVKVNVIQDFSYKGFLHAFDPVSKSVILLILKEDHYKMTLIPGHAILNMKEESTSLKPPDRKLILEPSEEEVTMRKRKIIAWLEKNLLPVREKEGVIDLGSASILAPYGSNEIFTNNPVIAAQIQKVISNMPDDFEP